MKTQVLPTVSFQTAIPSLMNLLENSIGQMDRSNYPPYNLLKVGQDKMKLELAVAGFTDEEIDISTEGNVLTISGTKAQAETETDDEMFYLHRGLAQRSFRQRYRLGRHVKVTGANMVNGILTIDMVIELPDEAKPRKIEITRS